MSKNGWRESLKPRIDKARERLAERDPAELVDQGGLSFDEKQFNLPLLGSTYVIQWPELVVTTPEGETYPEELQILLLDYLDRADGSKPTGHWIGFQELPNGSFYRKAFQGYSGDQLVSKLAGDIDSFHCAAKTLGGDPLQIGDAGYVFRVLPFVPLAIVWWGKDDEFSANATVLFDKCASHYLPTDGLAILGKMLCRQLTKLGELK